jgi:F-type H+-transporting ATPase subunit b
MEILAKLGVDKWLLLAQGVNFIVLLLVLTRFVYRPFIRHLDERAARIEGGLTHAREAEERLKAAASEQAAVLRAAAVEAKGIVADAAKRAKEYEAAEVKAVETRIEKMLADGETRLSEEKAKLIREAKSEVEAMVVSLTESVLRTKLDAKADAELIQKIIKA